MQGRAVPQARGSAPRNPCSTTQTGSAIKQCGTACPQIETDTQTVTPQTVLITRPVLKSSPSTLIGVPTMVYADSAGHALRCPVHVHLIRIANLGVAIFKKSPLILDGPSQ